MVGPVNPATFVALTTTQGPDTLGMSTVEESEAAKTGHLPTSIAPKLDRLQAYYSDEQRVFSYDRL